MYLVKNTTIVLGTLFFLFLSTSCLKSKEPGIPDAVRETLNESGINRQELMKAIVHYKSAKDSLKLEALYWLLANMRGNYTIYYNVEDSLGHQYSFPPNQYKNYIELKKSWDSVTQRHGPLSYKADSFLLDEKTVKATFLINNIDEAFKSYQAHQWSKKYNFNLFCHWILTYRCINEPLENFRNYFFEKYKSYLPNDSNLSVTEVALTLNNLINDELTYKDNYNKEIRVQTIRQIEKNKSGNFYDINCYKVKVLRSFGIAAALDYTPFLADTSFGYCWTTVILPNQSELMLTFRQKVKNLHRKGRLAKIYRHTYERDSTGLFIRKSPHEYTPPFLGDFFYTDISGMLDSKTVRFPLFDRKQRTYLAVFNDGNWHPIDWGRTSNKGIDFNKMKTHIVYLPVKVEEKRLFQLGSPFLLNDNGQIHEFIPDFSSLQKAILLKTAPFLPITPGVEYTLYLWNGNWTSMFTFKGSKRGFEALLPINGLYLLSHDNSILNDRIFSQDKSGNQIFY